VNTTLKTLSALTIATAALAATVLPSSALPSGPVGTFLGNGARHGLLPAQPPKVTLPPVASKLGSIYGHGISCLACNLPHPPARGHGPVTWPYHGDNWGHGWNRGYGWQPEAVVVGGPVPSAPAPVPTIAAAPAVEPCNCLTKQSMPDGSVLFQDICTKESAIAPPMTVGAR
jgi:hypothetical protein